MPDYWLQIDVAAELDLDQMTARAAEVIRLVGIDGDIEVNSVSVTRWTDEDGDEDPVAPLDEPATA